MYLFSHGCESTEDNIIQCCTISLCVHVGLTQGLNPWPRGHEFHNVGGGLNFHGHQNHAFSFSNIYGSKEEDFLRF